MFSLRMVNMYSLSAMVIVAFVCSNLARRYPCHQYIAAGLFKMPKYPLMQHCSTEGPLSNMYNEEAVYGSVKKREDVHLIVLVHGWKGNPSEMESLRELLLLRGEEKESHKTNVFKRKERTLVHSAVCNDGQTHDGIEAGGTRLANEINNLIQELWNRESQNVRISLVGNSLGGLYARYALSLIQWQGHRKKQMIIPHHFVTTATPHLGIGHQQTYLPLPRFVEIPIAHAIRRTGKDLFRISNIIEDMTLDDKFTAPLSRFRRRIAYINVYGTDFQVPTPTAAFWADTDSVHHVVEQYTDGARQSSFESSERYSITSEDNDERPRNIIMKLTTPTQKKQQRMKEQLVSLSNNAQDDEGARNLLSEDTKGKEREADMPPVASSTICLSLKLDELGWTKVLVDIREEMPINLDSLQQSPKKNQKEGNQIDLNSKTEWTSRELLEQFDTGRLKSFPLGHTVLIANAKNEFYRNMNKGGMPIMDDLAKELVNST
jgi:hypothetical protein